MLAGSHFLERLPYLGARLGSGDDVQPVLLGRLCIGRHDFHLVAAVQYLLQLCVLAVYLGSYTFAAQLAVDVEGEVEHGMTTAEELKKYPHKKIMSSLEELLEREPLPAAASPRNISVRRIALLLLLFAAFAALFCFLILI